jgi:2-aminobenzoate-CoA ligase
VPRIHEDAAIAPRELWPDRVYTLPELRLTAESNLSVELVDRHLPSRAGHTAIVAPDGRVTFAQLAEQVARLGHALGRLGVRPGDRIVIRLPNGAKLASAWLAVQRVGAIAVTTSPALRAREFGAIVADAEPAACIVASDLADAALLRACEAVANPPRVALWGEATRDVERAVSLDQLIRDAPDRLDPVGRPPDSVAVILYTADAESAAPKGACHSIGDVLATAKTYARCVLDLGPDDVVGGAAGLAFAFGLGAMLVFPLHAGATSVLSDGFDADALCASLGRERITLLFGTATTYRLLLRVPGFDRRTDWRSLRLAISSAEPLDAALAAEWHGRTGVELLDGFGTTEMAHMVLSQRPGECGSGRLGSAVPGYEVRLVDAAFNDVAEGESGRLVVRGPTGCRYWRRADRQRQHVQRGWNVTGDWCARDRGLRFAGRRDRLIVSAGYNISPVEVEAVLREHAAVAGALVVAAPDPVRGVVPKALVVPRPNVGRVGLDLAIMQHVRDALAGYKCPRQLAFVDALPRAGGGDVERGALREA